MTLPSGNHPLVRLPRLLYESPNCFTVAAWGEEAINIHQIFRAIPQQKTVDGFEDVDCLEIIFVGKKDKYTAHYIGTLADLGVVGPPRIRTS